MTYAARTGGEELARDTVPTKWIGSPATCIDFVQKHIDVGIDQLIFPVQFGTLTNDQIKGSVRLFTEQVMPKFCSVTEAARAQTP